jgi:hypothetical protein
LEDRIFYACIAEQKKNNGQPFWERLNKELNYGKTGEALRNDVKNEKRKRGFFNPNSDNYQEQEESSSYDQGNDFINVVCASKRMLSKEDVIKQFNIDTNIWEIERFKVKTSEGYRKDRSVEWHVKNGSITQGDVSDSGRMLVVPLYHIEVRLVKKKQEWSEEIIKKLFDNLESKNFNKLKYKSDYVSNGKALFVAFADLHYGMMATEKVTGNTYNMTVAEDLVEKAISQILQRVKGQKYEKIVLLLGNDFLNCDNIFGTTTAGTPQDNDSSWFDMMDGAAEMVIKMIQSFLPIAPVDVYSVNSNHDTHSYYGLSKAIEFYFKDDKNVSFENSPITRKYFSFGKNLVALSHDMPVKKALEIITTEAKEKWSEATHMYCILAHLHSAMNYEKQGYLEIYRLPTISGWSRWTNEKGYQQTEKRTQCFVFDKENGITDIMNIVVV